MIDRECESFHEKLRKVTLCAGNNNFNGYSSRFQSKLVGDGSPGHVLMYDNREQSACGWSVTAFASHPESFRLVSNHLNGVFPFIYNL